jgi:hypothetical protein
VASSASVVLVQLVTSSPWRWWWWPQPATLNAHGWSRCLHGATFTVDVLEREVCPFLATLYAVRIHMRRSLDRHDYTHSNSEKNFFMAFGNPAFG